MPEQKQYLVIIQHPVPKPAPQLGNLGYSARSPRQVVVRTVTARNEQAAAEQCTVPAGAIAYVTNLKHVSKFMRPAQAPLEAA